MAKIWFLRYEPKSSQYGDVMHIHALNQWDCKIFKSISRKNTERAWCWYKSMKIKSRFENGQKWGLTLTFHKIFVVVVVVVVCRLLLFVFFFNINLVFFAFSTLLDCSHQVTFLNFLAVFQGVFVKFLSVFKILLKNFIQISTYRFRNFRTNFKNEWFITFWCLQQY